MSLSLSQPEPSFADGLTVTVYSGPACMRCQVTKSQLASAGIDYEEKQAADHPEIIEEVERLGLKRELPVVAVTNTNGGDMLWTGLDRENIKALKYLFEN